MKGKAEAVRAAAMLAFIIVLAFWNVVFQGRTLSTSTIAPGTLPSGAYGYTGPRVHSLPVLDPGSSAWDYEPDAKILRDDLSKRALPLWNPYVGCGAPFLANSFSAALSPLRLLVAVGERPFFWDLYLLARLLIAGFLTFLFARRIGMCFAGSMIAAIIFMFSGHFVLEMNMPDADAQIWLPGLLLAVEELLNRPSYRVFVGTAALVALIILSGMPESAFFVFFLSGVYFVVRMLILPSAVLAGKASRWKHLMTFGGASVAGLLLSLPLVLPFLEYLRYAFNPRAPGVGAVHVDVSTAASLIMPRFFGHLHQTWTGVSSFSILPYAGAASILLALAALSQKKLGWRTIFFASFAIFYLLKAFGVPPIQWVSQLPLFNMSVFPKHAFPEFALCAAILAGLGAEALLQKDVAYLRLGIASLLVVLMVIAFGAYYWKPATQAGALKGVVRSGVIVVSNTVVLWGLAWASRRFGPRRLVALGLIVFPMAELIAFIPAERTQRYDPFTRPPFVDFLRADPQIYRTFSTDNFLYPNTNAAYAISDIRSLDPLQVGRYIEFVRKDISPKTYDRFDGSEPTRNILRSPLLDLMNVKYVLASAEIPGQDSAGALSDEGHRGDARLTRDSHDEKFTLVYDNEVKIYRNNNVLPRAFVVHQSEVIPDRDRILDKIGQAGFDPRNIVLLEGPLSDDAAQTASHATHDSVVLDQYEPNYIHLQASSGSSGWLVLTDTYYPGWEVRVDGKTGQILPADYMFRAVPLEPGTHVIEFKYRPFSFELGGGISVATIMALFMAGIVIKLRSGSAKPIVDIQDKGWT
jgi:Bacterial membrane protein YfhO